MAEKSRETIFGAAEVLALALTVGFVGLCIAFASFYDSDHLADLVRAW